MEGVRDCLIKSIIRLDAYLSLKQATGKGNISLEASRLVVI